MMPLFWLHWLHAPSLVSIGQSKLKLLSRNWISIFSNSDLDLDHIHLGSNSKLRLDVSYPYTKFGVNRPKHTKLIERKLNFHFSNIDLDHRHLGGNLTLCLDVSYPYTMFCVNRPKQTKVIPMSGNQKLTPARQNAHPPAADFSITITWFSLKTWLKRIYRKLMSSLNLVHLTNYICRYWRIRSCSHSIISYEKYVIR